MPRAREVSTIAYLQHLRAQARRAGAVEPHGSAGAPAAVPPVPLLWQHEPQPRRADARGDAVAAVRGAASRTTGSGGGGRIMQPQPSRPPRSFAPPPQPRTYRTPGEMARAAREVGASAVWLLRVLLLGGIVYAALILALAAGN